MHQTTKLRSLLKENATLSMPGAYDCLSAKVIEQMGFPAVYLTGYGTEASRLGYPDMGFITMTEMADHAGNIANCVNIPVISDADTGFGGLHNVMRLVREYEKRGVAGLHLEDQAIPKKCPSLGAGTVNISVDEMVAKIKAAQEARTDPDFIIIGRTDSKTKGFDEVIRRLKIYEEAGADLLMVGETYTAEELKILGSKFRGKLVLTCGVKGRSQVNISNAELAEIGIKIAIYPVTAVGAAAKAVHDIYKPLLDRQKITDDELNVGIWDMKTVNSYLQLDKYVDIERRHPF